MCNQFWRVWWEEYDGELVADFIRGPFQIKRVGEVCAPPCGACDGAGRVPHSVTTATVAAFLCDHPRVMGPMVCYSGSRDTPQWNHYIQENHCTTWTELPSLEQLLVP